MALLTQDRADGIARQIAQAESLGMVLDVLGAQIAELNLAEGYLVNLLDAGGSELVTLKVSFPDEFRSLEQPTLGRRNPLTEDSIHSRAFRTGQIQRVDAGNASEHEGMVLQYWHTDEIVGVPIVHPQRPGQAIGVVVLLRQHGRIDAGALASVQEVLALMHAGLKSWLRLSHLEEMQEQATAAVAENKRLLQFLDDLNSLTAVDMIYEMFAAELFRQLPFDLAGFGLVEGDMMATKKICVASPRDAAVAEEWLDFMGRNPYPLDPRVSGAVLVLSQNEAMLFPDIQTLRDLPMSEHDARSVAILKTARTLFMSPIRYQKNAIGIFVLYSLREPITLTEADMHLLQQLSSFLGTAITNSQTYAISQAQNLEIGHLNEMLQEKVKELAEQASTDRLTGLLNFRSYEREMNKRIKECRRASGRNEFSLVLIDIDYFKRFNDAHGHAAGNDVLAGVAAEIGRVIRGSDTAFRYGGEEFAVILPKCDTQGALLLAERIRTAIEARDFKTEGGTHRLTISIGCATFRPDDTQHTLFTRADQALYEAKGQGRNRVCSA